MMKLKYEQRLLIELKHLIVSALICCAFGNVFYENQKIARRFIIKNDFRLLGC